MRLRDNDDSHSIYVLYSDLLFNVLIIFLIVVLALVLRLNHSFTRIVAREQQAAAPAADPATIERLTRERDQTQKYLIAMVAKYNTVKTASDNAADAANAEIAAQKQTAAAEIAMQKKAAATALAEISNKLSIAAGANRFSGRSGSTSLSVAVDFSQARPMYVLVNASEFDSAMSTLDGESTVEHALRSARVLTRATKMSARFSAEELVPIFRAMDVRVGQENATKEGRLLFSFSLRASAAASGWLDNDGDISAARALSDTRDIRKGSNLSDFHDGLIDSLLKLRDTFRSRKDPESVPVIHFRSGADNQHLNLANREIPVPAFREIVSAFGGAGIILEYDADNAELCPDSIIRNVLTPIGYVNSVPDGKELKRLSDSFQKSR